MGIGTNSPISPLTVIGGGTTANTLALQANQSTNTNKYSGMVFGRYADASTYFTGIWGDSRSDRQEVYIGGGVGSAYSATAIRFFTGSAIGTAVGTERMSIASSGEVGIGGYVGGYQFEVIKDGGATMALYDTADYDASPSASLTFRNTYKADGSTAPMGHIEVEKENTTVDEYGGNMVFYTRDHGSAEAEAFRLNADKSATFAGAYTFPTADGSANQVLATDGSGTLTWEDAGSGGGKALQIAENSTGAVATGSTTMPYDDTIPQNTEGTEFLTQAITPANTANKLKIDISLNLASSNARWVTVAVFQDSTANAVGSQSMYFSGGDWMYSWNLSFVVDAGTTSSTTFKVRIGTSSGDTITLNGTGGSRKNGGVAISSISIIEFDET